MDPDTARKKMQDFQLPDPAQYLLAFVQALVARGAGRLDVEIDADDVRFTSDGEPFSATDLDRVFNALFMRSAGADTKSIRQLAIGICTAEATEPGHIEVRTGGPEGTRRLLLRPGEPVLSEATQPGERSTHIHVKYGLRRRVQRWLELRERDDELVELLRSRCRNAELAVTVNGERVNRGLVEVGMGGDLFETERFRGFVARSHIGDRSSLVKLVQHGVWFTTVQVDGLRDGTFAIVDSPWLSKDISQQHVVQNDVYADLVQTLKDVQSGKLEAKPT
jgi:hypothetical protein